MIRAVNLLVVLPLILAYFSSDRKAPTETSTPLHLASAIRFDRWIAAISIFMDASANVLVAISPTSSHLFVFLTSLNALTSGGHPALQSLGAISSRAMGKGNEMGLVFGALGFSSAISHIVAPGTYAAIYGATVSTFPKAMFVVSAALLYIAVSVLACMRPSIHIPQAEPESAIALPASEEVEEARVIGPCTQVQTRSHNGELERDVLQRASMISLSIPEA